MSAGIDTILYKDKVTRSEKIRLVLKLSFPAILAELTSIAMQYIDAAMVGRLEKEAMAAIGLVSSTTWLLGGMCIGFASGFSVQVAHLIGARKDKEGAAVLRQGLGTLLFCSLLLMGFALGISPYLPKWLGGEKAICSQASQYFFIYACTIPFAQMRYLASGMLQCSGNMKTPSILNSLLCLLDVIFNLFLIFPTRRVKLVGMAFTLPGAGLGVKGAALGTGLAEICISMAMLITLCFFSKKLRIHRGDSWKWKKEVTTKAAKIAVPMTLDHVFMCSAYVAGTHIIAPLKSTAIAANSLAVTAESLCYMPGYGIGSAATTLVGQAIGAGKEKLAKSFAKISTVLGMVLMGISGIVMYIIAPIVFALLTKDGATAELGTQVLRLELIAEPLYGASIVCAGAFRGAGDTLIPSIMNLGSMWGVRIVLAAILVPRLGLSGYWIAMCIELCFRGIIFLIRMARNSWMKDKAVSI